MSDGIDYRRDRKKPWRARYLAPGGRRPSKSFRTKREAEQWRRSELSRLDRGLWLDPAGGRTPFAEYAEHWLTGLVGLKEKTLVGYAGLLNSRVLPAFGAAQIQRIRPRDVREWIGDMDREGLSASRIRQAHQVVRACLDQAVVDGLIVRNPASKDAGIRLPTDRPRAMTVLNPAEVHRLADAAERQQQGAGVLVKFLAYTGLRWGEAVALRVKSLNLLRRQVEVNASATEIGGRLVVGTPKTHRVRTVLLPRSLAGAVGAYLEHSPRPASYLLFTTPSGAALRSGNFRKAVWKPATESLASSDDRFASLVIHDLRHTAASLAISSGGSIKAVQRMLGHRRASTTLDLYGHLYQEDLETLADRLDELIQRWS